MDQKSPKIHQIKDTAIVSWRLIKLVWGIDKWLLITTTVATIIPGIVPFINIYIYKLVIDYVVDIARGKTADLPFLLTLIGFRVLSYFAQSASITTQDIIERLLWLKMPIRLNELIMAKTSSLDMQQFESPQFRDLLEKVKDAFSMRPQNLLSYLLFSLQSLVQFLIAAYFITRLNWLLILPIILIAVPEFITQTQMSKLTWGVWSWNSPFRKRFWYLSNLLADSGSIKEIKIFRLAERFINEVKELQSKFYSDNKKVALKSYRYNILFQGLSTLVFIGVEVYIIFKALARQVTIGDINLYTGVVTNFQNGLSGLFSNLTRLFDNALYVKSIFELLDTQPIIKESKIAKPIDYTKAPKIEFQNVSFSYPGSSREILKNFNLVISPGDKIALVGENGAGKSTIIKLLVRFYDVEEGKILINDISIKEVKLDDLYRLVGVLFQDFNRYEHTVGENIYFGRAFEKMQLEKIVEAAKNAGAHSVVKTLDKGYEQMLGRTFEGGIELSGGQWQKIALARAFLRNAPTLILDEPTAAIDAKAESEIFNRVERLSREKTVIIISHRFSTVRNADKIYVIDNGEIIESGSHQQLMKLNGQYAELFKIQAKGYQ